MRPPMLAALALVAGALLVLPPACTLRTTSRVDAVNQSRSLPPRWRRAVVMSVGCLALTVLLGAWPWWVGAALAGVSASVAARLPDRRSNADRAVDRHRLAVHADLLAACLDAGMSVGAAILAVPAQLETRAGAAAGRLPPADDDPLRLLDAVAALLVLGADSDTAWRSAQQHPDLQALAAAAKRSATAGAGFADAVREHAVNLRAGAAAAAERAAGRAGVAMTAPLGMCFLPAFLCLGLAPVVVGLLSSLSLF
jgi:hypothetical protein